MRFFVLFSLVLLTLLPVSLCYAQAVEPSISLAENSATQESATEEEVEASRLDELLSKLRQGGVVVVVQILLSVFGLAVALERLVNLRSKALVPPALAKEADRLWKLGKYDEVIQTCRKDGSLLGKVIVDIVRHRSAGHQVASQMAGDVAAREIRRHMQRLFPIALVATLEPLLGLLGTMLGMIGAFETVAVAGSMGDASILADDIAKALVTTAVGLVIAIPAVFIYHYLKSQVGFGSATLDQTASNLISDWMILGPENPTAAPAAVASPSAIPTPASPTPKPQV